MAPGAADSVSNNLTQDCFFFDEKCSLASDENIIRSASSVRDRLFDPFVPHVLGIGTANPDRIVTKEDLFRDYVPILDSPKLRVIATGISSFKFRIHDLRFSLVLTFFCRAIFQLRIAVSRSAMSGSGTK